MKIAKLVAGLATVAAGAVSVPAANAAVVAAYVNGPTLTTAPFTISLPNSTARFTFSAAASPFGPGAAVATTGTGQVSTIFGGIADFFADSTIDGNLSFAAYPTATLIPFSAADDYVGFSFTQTDGTHYGYAEVFGPSVVKFGYQTSPNTAILTGVPEPAGFAVLLSGLATLAVSRRRKV